MNQLPSTVRRRAVLTGLANAPLAATAATTAAAEAGPTLSPFPARTIYIAGDSTAATKVRNLAPETGWGWLCPTSSPTASRWRTKPATAGARRVSSMKGAWK